MTNNIQITEDTAMVMLRIEGDIRDIVQEHQIVPGTKFALATPAVLAVYKTQEETLANNAALPLETRKFALEALEQIQGVETVFNYVKQYGFDPSNLTCEKVVAELTRYPLNRWVKPRPLGNIGSSVKDASNKAVDSTLSAINRFANFVATKTQR